METDSNDVCVRDVEIQMQIVVFRIGGKIRCYTYISENLILVNGFIAYTQILQEILWR